MDFFKILKISCKETRQLYETFHDEILKNLDSKRDRVIVLSEMRGVFTEPEINAIVDKIDFPNESGKSELLKLIKENASTNNCHIVIDN